MTNNLRFDIRVNSGGKYGVFVHFPSAEGVIRVYDKGPEKLIYVASMPYGDALSRSMG